MIQATTQVRETSLPNRRSIGPVLSAQQVIAKWLRCAGDGHSSGEKGVNCKRIMCA